VADVIAHIDGFNLYDGLRDRGGRRYLWPDLVRLVRHLRPRDSILAAPGSGTLRGIRPWRPCPSIVRRSSCLYGRATDIRLLAGCHVGVGSSHRAEMRSWPGTHSPPSMMAQS